MAGQKRIDYEGAIYHKMSGGDRREAIFRDYLDRWPGALEMELCTYVSNLLPRYNELCVTSKE